MERLILAAAVLFVGHSHAVLNHFDDGDDPRAPCDIIWINNIRNNCSIEVTCSELILWELELYLQKPLWRCAVHSGKDEEHVEEYIPLTHINLKLIGRVNLFLLYQNSESVLLHSTKQILLKNDFVDLPQTLYEFKALEDIEVYNYKIRNLNLTLFSEFKELKKLNLSQNSIKNIANNTNDDLSKMNKLELLDLSHNLIEDVGISWKLGNITLLRYLDLSNNAIKNIQELAFRGLTRLQNLHLSHNYILQIGNSLANLYNIEEITLDHNKITAIKEPNFVGLEKLKKIYLNSNAIQSIEDQAFVSLVKLKELDLSHNEITTIQKQLFRNNNELCFLSLKNNHIEEIEHGAFHDKNITKFCIQNNAISGTISEDFHSIRVQNLDLSGMEISSVGPKIFNAAVQYLNLSRNSIKSIDNSAFLEVKHLKSLDISCNRLIEVNFDLSFLQELSLLYLQQNHIQVLKRTSLENLTELEELDLSENWLVEVETKSFTEMKKILSLRLNKNIGLKSFRNGTFDGLVSLLYLDFSNTGISDLQNELFSDLKKLELLDASNCEIEKIQYRAFRNLYSIVEIKLSHNLLTEFSVYNKDINQVRELLLDFNKIKYISDETFYGLSRLSLLDLSSNNIAQISDNAFHSVTQLRTLNLDSNTNMEFKPTTFSNLALNTIFLRNVTKTFNFEQTSNTSISKLDLSSCEIENVDSVYCYKLNVKKLLLNFNQITRLDKHSFQNLSSLQFLDISSNAISYIQPGTFLRLENLEILNLHDNSLSKLELGAFEGLKSLQTLNLSNNEIVNFKYLNVRKLVSLKTISLESNKIESFNFNSFHDTGIKKIYIGGNYIACEDLIAALHKQPFLFTHQYIDFTAENLDFHAENIDGITCRHNPEHATLFVEQQTNVTLSLANAIEKLQVTLSKKNSLIENSAVDSSKVELGNVSSNDSLHDPVDDVMKRNMKLLFEKHFNKFLDDYKTQNDNHSSNDHGDVKSLVYVTVACLVMIVVLCLSIFFSKVKWIFFRRLRRTQTDIPLINNGIEID